MVDPGRSPSKPNKPPVGTPTDRTAQGRTDRESESSEESSSTKAEDTGSSQEESTTDATESESSEGSASTRVLGTGDPSQESEPDRTTQRDSESPEGSATKQAQETGGLSQESLSDRPTRRNSESPEESAPTQTQGTGGSPDESVLDRTTPDNELREGSVPTKVQGIGASAKESATTQTQGTSSFPEESLFDRPTKDSELPGGSAPTQAQGTGGSPKESLLDRTTRESDSLEGSAPIRAQGTGGSPVESIPDRTTHGDSELPVGSPPDKTTRRSSKLPGGSPTDRTTRRPSKIPGGSQPDRTRRLSEIPVGLPPDRTTRRPSKIPGGLTPDRKRRLSEIPVGLPPDKTTRRPSKIPGGLPPDRKRRLSEIPVGLPPDKTTRRPSKIPGGLPPDRKRRLSEIPVGLPPDKTTRRPSKIPGGLPPDRTKRLSEILVGKSPDRTTRRPSKIAGRLPPNRTRRLSEIPVGSPPDRTTRRHSQIPIGSPPGRITRQHNESPSNRPAAEATESPGGIPQEREEETIRAMDRYTSLQETAPSEVPKPMKRRLPKYSPNVPSKGGLEYLHRPFISPSGTEYFNGLDFLEHGADFEAAISATGFGRFHFCLLAVTGLIYSNTAIGITIVSFVLPAATCDFKMTSADKGWLTAAPMLGMVIGSYFWGCLADTKGRKVVLVSTLLMDGFVGIISSFVQILPIFMVCRFVNGFSVAGAMGICFPYLGEFQQTKYREKILCWMEMFWTLGVILLPLIAWGIIPITGIRIENESFSYDSWNWFVAACGIPSLMLGCWLFYFPESPKFMMECGDYDEALKVLQWIYKTNTGDDPENYPIKSLKEKVRTISVGSQTSVKSIRSLSMRKPKELKRLFSEIWHQTKALCRPPYLKYTILTCIIQFGLTTSYYTLMVWFPELFNRYEEFETRFPNTSASVCDVSGIVVVDGYDGDPFDCDKTIDSSVYMHTLIVGLACIPTSLWLPLCVHKLGAKFFLIFSLGFAGVVTIGLYFVQNSQQNLALSCIFEALTSLAISLVFCVLVDLFPTNLRVMAAALSLTAGRGGGLIGNLSFGYLIDINCVIPIVVFSAFLFLAAVLCFFLPKTGQEALD